MFVKRKTTGSTSRATTLPRGILTLCAALGLTVATAGLTPAHAADTFSLGTGLGIAGGTGVAVPLTATHDQGMQGFAVAVSFDPIPVDVTGVDFVGTAVETILGGAPPEYLGVETDNVVGTLTAGVIFGFSPVPPLNQLPQLPASPTTPNHLLNILFDISPTVLPGNVPVILEDALGVDPGVITGYSSDGQTIDTANGLTLSDGEVVINNLVTFEIDSRNVVPGGTLTVDVNCEHPEDRIVGFQVALTYDSSKLTFTAPPDPAQYWQWTDLGTRLGFLGEEIEFLNVVTQAYNPVPGQGFVAILAQFDFSDPLNGQDLPPSTGSPDSILRLQFNVANNIGLVGTTTQIQFNSSISPANPGGPIPPPAPNIIVNEIAQGIPPITVNSTITFVSGPSFRRADANNDGTVNLADAIALLSYLFSGGAAPMCYDMGDVNDDGGIDISDAISILGYLFNDATPPAHPFPGCGVDTTPSADPFWVECATSPSATGCP